MSCKVSRTMVVFLSRQSTATNRYGRSRKSSQMSLMAAEGSQARITYPINLRESLWKIHRTPFIPFYRFLCPPLCPHSFSTNRSQKGCQVSSYLLHHDISRCHANLVASKTAMYYICQGCQSFYEQPLGRMVEKVHESSGNVNLLFKTQAGPPVPQKCTECGSALHVSIFDSNHGLDLILLQIAGPMWSGPLHNDSFILKVLEHLESNQGKYGTAVRMKGMLTVAKEVRFKTGS